MDINMKNNIISLLVFFIFCFYRSYVAKVKKQ
jgi:hypothetical protein